MVRENLYVALLSVASLLALTVRPVLADEVDDMKAQVQTLNQQILNLEQAQATSQKKEPDNVVGGSFPGSFKLPGTDTSVAIHGFVNLQAYYDPQQYLGPKFQIGNAIPNGLAQKQTQGVFTSQYKATRFTIETRTPTQFGELKTVLANDFYFAVQGPPANCASLTCSLETGGQSVQNFNFGLRNLYAYGVLGHFLVGHYLSNFIDEEDQAEVLDVSGPTAIPAQQLPQIRYTMPVGPMALSLALEAPVTDFAFTSSAVTQGNPLYAQAGGVGVAVLEQPSQYNPRPDVTLKLQEDAAWGHFQVSAASRLLSYDDGAGHRSTVNAGGVLFGATYNLKNNYSVGAMSFFGNGIQKYIPDDFVPVSSAQIANIGTPQQQIFPTNVHSTSAFIGHTFSPMFRANLGLGYTGNEWQAFIPADITQPAATHTLHFNVIYSPVPQTDFGFEIANGSKTFRPELGLPSVVVNRYITNFTFRF